MYKDSDMEAGLSVLRKFDSKPYRLAMQAYNERIKAGQMSRRDAIDTTLVEAAEGLKDQTKLQTARDKAGIKPPAEHSVKERMQTAATKVTETAKTVKLPTVFARTEKKKVTKVHNTSTLSDSFNEHPVKYALWAILALLVATVVTIWGNYMYNWTYEEGSRPWFTWFTVFAIFPITFAIVMITGYLRVKSAERREHNETVEVEYAEPTEKDGFVVLGVQTDSHKA